MQLLDGKKLAAQIQAEIAGRVKQFEQQGGPTPCLAAVLVGDDPASQVYVANKEKACKRVGIASRLIRMDAATTQAELLKTVAELNGDPGVHGILVQLPLPAHLDASQILDRIHPAKDVDAFHPENVGRLAQGRPRFLPCTPHGILQILARYEIATAGKHVVVVGRSDIVGKPLALLLMQRTSHLGPEMANATVTVCHSRTPDVARFTKEADILVAAVGRVCFITADMVRPGSVVIDVGMNREGGKLMGDVDFDAVAERASSITPVPGGVGRLTVTMLLENTLQAATLQAG